MAQDEDEDVIGNTHEEIAAAHERARQHLEKFNPAVEQTDYLRQRENRGFGSSQR